jgi:protein phosphatase
VGEHDLAIAHVGDSRLYVLRDGELAQITDDHSLVGELVRRGQISAEEAEEHPQRSIITRALGPEQEVVIDHYTWPVRDGDVYLLCSDGLTSMIADEKVAEILRGADGLTTAGQRLVEAANAAGGRDNITVILFRVEEITPRDGGVLAAGTTVRSSDAAAATQQATTATSTAVREPQARGGTTVLPRAPRPVPVATAPSPTRRRRRVPGAVKAAIVVVVLLGLVASGAWIASRSVYFVGTDEEGFVTLYQGLPYDLPGFSLYQEQFISGVPAQALSPRLRDTVTDHKLRSQQDAVDLVRQLERGDLAGQR